MTAGAFDLSSIADGLYIGWYRRKWIPNLSISMFLLGASAVVIALAVRASFGSGFGGTSESDLVLASFFCALGALILWGANRTYRHAASSIVVDPIGVTVEYPGSRRIRLEWSDPAFRLKIGTMHSYTLARDIRKVHFWWTPPLFMDVETAEALLAAARNIGLTPVEVDDGFSSTGKSVLISHQKF